MALALLLAFVSCSDSSGNSAPTVITVIYTGELGDLKITTSEDAVEYELEGYTVEESGYNLVTYVDETLCVLSLDDTACTYGLEEGYAVTLDLTLTDLKDGEAASLEDGDYGACSVFVDGIEISASDFTVTSGTHTVSITVYDAEGDSLAGYETAVSAGSGNDTDSVTASLEFYPSQYLEFVLGSAADSVNIFYYIDNELEDGDLDSLWGLSNFKVYLDGELTELAPNCITAEKGAAVKIKLMGKKVFPVFHFVLANSMPAKELVSLPTLGTSPDEALTSLCLGSASRYPSPFAGVSNSKSYLQTIPSDLFRNNQQLTDMSYAFYYTNLTSIPEGLFDYTPGVTSMSYVFAYCESLTSKGLPEGLFDYTPGVTNMCYAFDSCYDLTSIPEGLFDNMTEVTDMSYIFRSCLDLSSVPESLFLYNTEITKLDLAFFNCNNLTPVVYIGSEKVTSAKYFADSCATSYGRVYVKEGSTTYTTFSKATSYANVSVVAVSDEDWPE